MNVYTNSVSHRHQVSSFPEFFLFKTYKISFDFYKNVQSCLPLQNYIEFYFKRIKITFVD